MPRTINPFNPADWLALTVQQQALIIGASETIFRRNMMMAMGQMSAVEAVSMWFEKPSAFAKGFEKSAMAAARGASGVQVMTEFLRPLSASAASNAKRLSR